MKFFDTMVEHKYGRISRHIFFRCHACHGIVVRDDIKENGACKCGGKRFSPTNLTFLEELRMIWKAIW